MVGGGANCTLHIVMLGPLPFLAMFTTRVVDPGAKDWLPAACKAPIPNVRAPSPLCMPAYSCNRLRIQQGSA